MNTHAPADPRHCCATITRTWIHFHPEQHAVFTHACETRKQCVGYTTTFTQALERRNLKYIQYTCMHAAVSNMKL